ncbi:MAG: TetR/AcrR family transcriptional regulator [Treponema sp.]|nr:TetR/AcrR family transcriptional regulator [Candidatus Treponema equifaecale]
MKILNTTLELLTEKEPSEIGMRDVAKKCGISATSIYTYYKDKNEIFIKISVSSINNLKNLMSAKVSSIEDPKEKIRTALETYRDWCFENPKTAILIFSKLEEKIDAEDIMSFYICNHLGEDLMYECQDRNRYSGEDIKLDTGIIISGLWGCIESIITKRADPIFWTEGKKFTDRFIQLTLDSLIGDEKNESAGTQR